MDFEIKVNEKLSLRLRKEEDSKEAFGLVDKNVGVIKQYKSKINHYFLIKY